MPSSRLAKLTRPRTEGLVPRPRLFTALDAACARPVVWIAGPPGAGKTSLVSSYLDARKRPCLWYQVDAGDADPATFFYYLGLAAAELGGRKYKPLPLFTEEFVADLEGFARRFFRALFAQLPADGVLVLDNYQEVPERALFHAVVRIAAEELPDGATLCSVSRVEPPCELARLRASQRLSAIGWEDLKLTVEETAAISADAKPDATTLAILREQSAGWAAGVVLMLERLRQTGGIRPGNTHENLETIFDYFAGQVFHAASRETQEMLLRMAFLPRLTAETAQVITGNPEAGRLLATLAKRNLFIDRRYGEQTTYQFHALFREFLKVQARDAIGSAELQRTSHRAASLLQATGQPEDAFVLYAEQGAWQAAVSLIHAEAPQLLKQGRRDTLRRWIEALPLEQLKADGWTVYWYGIAQFVEDLVQARHMLVSAYEIFSRAGDLAGQGATCSAIIDNFYASTGDVRPLDEWSDRAVALLREDAIQGDADLHARLTTRYARALFVRKPLGQEMEAASLRLRALLDEEVEPAIKLYAAGLLLVVNWIFGRADRNDELIAFVDARTGFVDAGEGALRLYHYFRAIHIRNKLIFEDGVQMDDDSIRVDDTEIGPINIDLLRSRAGGLVLRRRFAEAHRMLREGLEPQIARVRTTMRGFHHWSMATCALAMKDYAEVENRVRAGLEVLSLGVVPGRLFMTPMFAGLLAAVGRVDEGGAMLRTFRAEFDLELNPSFSGRADLFAAFVALKQGRLSDVPRYLAAALPSLKQVGYRSWIIFPDPDFDRLFALALEHDIEPEFVTSLIRNHGIPAPDPYLDIWPWPLKLRLLGVFRIEGLPAEKSGKSQHKLNDLLKVIAVRGPAGVSLQALADELWPDSEGDSALNAAQVSLYRLRKMLGRDDAVRVDDGVVLLNREVCWVDAWAFEQKAKKVVAQQDLDSGRATAASEALRLYGGPLLADSRDQVWSLGAREHLRGIWIDLVRGLGRHLEGQGNWREADAHYRAALAIHPEVEEVHRGRLRCLQGQGAAAEAAGAYAYCREQLLAKTGRPPSPETERLYRQITA